MDLKKSAINFKQILKKNLHILKIIGLIILIAIPIGIIPYYFIIINTNYLSNFEYEQDLSFNRFNSSRWIVPSFQSTKFAFETETYGLDNPYRKNITYSVNYYNMGVTDWFKANKTEWGEWGYSFHHLYGQLDGAGILHYGKYPTEPTTKLEAYSYMQQYIVNRSQYLYNNTRPWVSFNGHYPYHHYAAAWGFDIIGSEIGENIDNYQVMMAFNRGAARQYNLPWFVDVSAWHSGTITDANVPSYWGESGGAEYGHSLSLFRRTYYMAYMAGASRVIAEGGYGNLFYRDSADADGLMDLTSLGETARDFVHVINEKDNGIPYTPIGIVLDELHGTIGFDSKKPKAFYAIPYSKGDYLTYDLLNLIYPNCWKSPENEVGALINNEYGDLFDIILQNASTDVLDSYPFLLLSGEIHFRPEEALRLVHYVEKGGNLIINSAYFEAINTALKSRNLSTVLSLQTGERVHIVPFSNQNQGNFILYGPDYSATMLQPILRELIPKVIPLSIMTSGSLGSNKGSWGAVRHIEYMFNRKEDGWILTLINNDGIIKEPKNSPDIDRNQVKYVQIGLNEAFLKKYCSTLQLKSITEWTTNTTIWSKNHYTDFEPFKFNINPGEIAIFEFKFSEL